MLGSLLAEVHHAGLVHGDFMLKNVLYCRDDEVTPYRMIDLASGWAMPSRRDGSAGQTRDLVRFICSMARSGMKLPEVRCFLESYGHSWDTKRPVQDLTRELFQLFLSASDRKAREAIRLLGVRPEVTSILEFPYRKPAHDRREEDLSIRPHLQRGGEHRSVPGDPSMG
jgi:hypothetical protein